VFSKKWYCSKRQEAAVPFGNSRRQELVRKRNQFAGAARASEGHCGAETHHETTKPPGKIYRKLKRAGRRN
jgi:hypothetical protein